MKKFQKNLCTILALVTLVCPITACSASENEANSDSATSGSSQESSEVANLNATGFPIVNEQITLSIFGSRDQNQTEWENMLTMQEYEKMTNIKIDYQEVPAQGFDEKKNLLFAADELPDMFVRSSITKEQVSMYGVTSKQLMPLDPYLEKFAPNISKIFSENSVIYDSQKAPDQQIYALPALDLSATGLLGFKQWINKDWLSKLGMQAPATLDEFKNLLIAFRDKDPNGNGQQDEIPFGIRDPGSIYVLGGSFGLDHQMGDTINIEDGKLHYWLTDDRFKEYLEWLHELYAEKLLWQDYYKTDLPAWRSNLSNALYGVMNMPYSDVFINVESQFTGLDPIKGPHGDQLAADAKTGISAMGAFAISSACKYPEAAMRWVDYFYGEEGSIFFRYGVEGKSFHYDEGMPIINDDILHSPEGFMTALGKISMAPGGAGPTVVTDKTDGIVASALTKEISAQQVKYAPKKIYEKPMLSQADMEIVTAITQDLNKYRDESVTKFILGEYGFDKWDEYCSTIDQIGLAQLEEIYQAAFDKTQK